VPDGVELEGLGRQVALGDGPHEPGSELVGIARPLDGLGCNHERLGGLGLGGVHTEDACEAACRPRTRRRPRPSRRQAGRLEAQRSSPPPPGRHRQPRAAPRQSHDAVGDDDWPTIALRAADGVDEIRPALVQPILQDRLYFGLARRALGSSRTRKSSVNPPCRRFLQTGTTHPNITDRSVGRETRLSGA
jgi:hypothetical protein